MASAGSTSSSGSRLPLSVLAAGPGHGYAIISALRDRSGGTFDLPAGTVYPALHRLEDGGSWSARGLM